MFEQAGHQMRLMENGLFVDSAPEGEKQKVIDENPRSCRFGTTRRATV